MDKQAYLDQVKLAAFTDELSSSEAGVAVAEMVGIEKDGGLRAQDAATQKAIQAIFPNRIAGRGTLMHMQDSLMGQDFGKKISKIKVKKGTRIRLARKLNNWNLSDAPKAW